MSEFNESIRVLAEDDRNKADVFNEPNQKLLENTKYNKEQIEALRNKLNEVLAQFDDYLTAEQLSELLAKGIKGDKGDPGEKGDKGDPGEVTLKQLEEAKTELQEEIANIPKVTKTSDINNDSGFITSNDIPTSLPASDVYDWAKQSTKPSYTASEVGASPDTHTHSYAGSSSAGGAATSANKVNSNLTLQLAGTTKNTFDGSSAKTFNVPAASTNSQGIVKLNNTLTSTSTTEAATAAQAKVLNDAIESLKTTSVNGKQKVADAINGKCGTSLTSATSYDDMAYYINTLGKKVAYDGVITNQSLTTNASVIIGYPNPSSVNFSTNYLRGLLSYLTTDGEVKLILHYCGNGTVTNTTGITILDTKLSAGTFRYNTLNTLFCVILNPNKCNISITPVGDAIFKSFS